MDAFDVANCYSDKWNRNEIKANLFSIHLCNSFAPAMQIWMMTEKAKLWPPLHRSSFIGIRARTQRLLTDCWRHVGFVERNTVSKGLIFETIFFSQNESASPLNCMCAASKDRSANVWLYRPVAFEQSSKNHLLDGSLRFLLHRRTEFNWTEE